MPVRDIGRSIGGAVLERLGRVARRFHEETPLPVDVLESEDAYLVVFDAPGATSSDVQVRYGDGTVTVQVDRFREVERGYALRYPGRGLQLDRSVDLPAGADVDSSRARAELKESGTLHVYLPKAGAPESGADTADGAESADAAAGE